MFPRPSLVIATPGRNHGAMNPALDHGRGFGRPTPRWNAAAIEAFDPVAPVVQRSPGSAHRRLDRTSRAPKPGDRRGSTEIRKRPIDRTPAAVAGSARRVWRGTNRRRVIPYPGSGCPHAQPGGFRVRWSPCAFLIRSRADTLPTRGCWRWNTGERLYPLGLLSPVSIIAIGSGRSIAIRLTMT